jgi:hypothetical protein
MPLGQPGMASTYNRMMAIEAATAFTNDPAAVNEFVCAANSAHVASATVNGSCATWTFTGPAAGHVMVDPTGNCTCPAVTDKSWN